jgi:exopolysaccharide biosynthesis protein
LPGDYQISELENPPRVVIDVPSHRCAEGQPYESSYDFSGGLLNQLRASAGPDGTRIVLESRFKLYWEIPENEQNNGLKITFYLRFRQTMEEMALDEGTSYIAKRYVTTSGQRFIHAVISDPSRSRLRPRIYLTSDITTRSLARVRDIAGGIRAAAVINGGYFCWPGISLSMVVENGIIKAPPQLHRPAFMIMSDGSFKMDYPQVHAKITSPYGIEYIADLVNQRPGPGHIAILTPGHPERLHSDMAGVKAVILDNVVEYITDGEIEDFSDRTILWSRKDYPPLDLLASGEALSIDYYFDNVSPSIDYAIQGGPFLLYNGRINITSSQDDIGSDISRGRAARTAVGFDNSGKFYMVVAEGSNSPNSIGATLEEMAWTLQDLGADWAMNLDGGSSSAMSLGNAEPETPLPSGTRPIATVVALIDESGWTQGQEFHF